MKTGPVAAMMRAGRLVLLGLALTGSVHAESARETLNWTGPYQGLLPCADCAGIVTLLELSEDGYRLYERYEGAVRDAGCPQRHDPLGRRRRGDLSGRVRPARRYKPGQGMLWALDLDGQVIEGDLADFYILTKAD